MQEFQNKAVESLNAIAFKNLRKTAAHYVGELKIICADNAMYDTVMKSFTYYESGDLVNIDTGNKWKEDAKEKWTKKYVVPYQFKAYRGLGAPSILEASGKILAGLTETGELDSEGDLPKIYVGTNRPKNPFCYSLKEWTDRKKQKNAVVRVLHKDVPGGLSDEEDVDKKAWSKFKREHGFTSAHMDELIHRATKQFLQKFMRASDNPKREEYIVSESFQAEARRVLAAEREILPGLAPLIAVYDPKGTLTPFKSPHVLRTAKRFPTPEHDQNAF
jgi:hypothetical protein